MDKPVEDVQEDSQIVVLHETSRVECIDPIHETLYDGSRCLTRPQRDVDPRVQVAQTAKVPVGDKLVRLESEKRGASLSVFSKDACYIAL